MLRKDIKLRISADIRGKISTGMKHEKGYPVSLDYFNINVFPELIAAYGEKPNRIAIIFPSNNFDDFIFTEYSAWGGKGKSAVKKRACDGETCTFNTTEALAGKTFEAGSSHPCLCKTLKLKDAEFCKCYTSIKAFIVNPQTGKIDHVLPYQFETHSVNSSDNILTQIMNIFSITGGKIMGVPFVLSVDMKEQLKSGEKKRFPIWSIQAVGGIKEILQLSENALLPVNEKSALGLLPGKLDQSRMLGSGEDKTSTHAEALPATVPKMTELALNDLPMERQSLLSRFADLQNSYNGNFKSKVNLVLKKNWDGDFESLSDADIQLCLVKIK